eukprot:scaffold98098_cov33-Tisochrysis_lutea.AAC.1
MASAERGCAGVYRDLESGQHINAGWEPNGDGLCGEMPAEIRSGFVRKVLSIVALQLLLTLGSTTCFVLSSPAREYILVARWPLYTAILAPFALLLGLSCYQRRHPLNLILLTGFTLAEAYTVGFVCAATYSAGYGSIIWQALVITTIVFGTLASFALITKQDFSQIGLVLFGMLWVLIIAGIFSIFFGPKLQLVYACAGVLLFTGLVLYDVSTLIHRFDPDDYVPAAIAL